MSDGGKSYRQILRSTSIIGGASVINTLIGLVRNKVLAVLLGPGGVGLFSLYSGLMSTAAALGSMGLGTVGTRQIAEAIGREDARALAVARRAMFWGTLCLAAAGGLVMWSLREVLALRLLGSTAQSGAVGWIALGVALSVASASQGALIQGMRRIGDMARLSVYGAAVNTLLGVIVLWWWGQAGLVAFVLVGPVVSFALGHAYVSRLPKPASGDISLREVAEQWKTLVRLGIPFMGAGIAGSLIQLWIRVQLGDSMGIEAVGHYQGAWLISMNYIGFVLGAMGADYYPRLTGVIHDAAEATRLVNAQTEIALLLGAPAFIAMMALAPWIIDALYTTDFAPAVEILRWQVLGDVLKVVSWPLGFVILAAGDGKTFFWTETCALALMGGLIVGLAPSMGLRFAGMAFLICYILYLPLVYVLARRRIGFHWSDRVVRLLVQAFLLCAGVGVLAGTTPWGWLVGCVIALGSGFHSLNRLSRYVDLYGPLRKQHLRHAD
jgi:O-antigen/teichoic acid export membrane protein